MRKMLSVLWRFGGFDQSSLFLAAVGAVLWPPLAGTGGIGLPGLLLLLSLLFAQLLLLPLQLFVRLPLLVLLGALLLLLPLRLFTQGALLAQ
jgi:hypothetical protein